MVGNNFRHKFSCIFVHFFEVWGVIAFFVREIFVMIYDYDVTVACVRTVSGRIQLHCGSNGFCDFINELGYLSGGR